nr:hypothetical protein [Tanacetum cinerariifolium]
MADVCVDVSCMRAVSGNRYACTIIGDEAFDFILASLTQEWGLDVKDYTEVKGKESLASDLLASSEAYEGEFSVLVRDLDVTMYDRGAIMRLA